MMKTLGIWLFLGSWFGFDPGQAETAHEKFAKEDFLTSLELYRSSLKEEAYQEQLGALHYNIAQCYMRLDSLDQMVTWFSKATSSLEAQSPVHASVAWNNLGAIYATRKIVKDSTAQAGVPGPGGPAPTNANDIPREQYEQALEYFKKAMRHDPDNDFARYNYELIKKMLQQQDQQQQQQDQEEQEDQENQNEDDKQNEQEEQEGDKNEEEESQQKKNGEENESDQGNSGQGKQGEQGDQQKPQSIQQAMQVLEAMQANETQFIQQLMKRPTKSSAYQDGPDW